METHLVKILKTESLTHNVNRYVVEKPSNYSFTPGQATDVSIDAPDLLDELRPFTFTGLNNWDFLEFTIKSYTDHDGITKKLAGLKPGDKLILHEVFGTIHYAGEGTFIAGGAGVTPFIAILRQLQAENKLGINKLIFSNRTDKDIILNSEFTQMLGINFINTLSDKEDKRYHFGRIDRGFLQRNINSLSGYFYLCGPDEMVEEIRNLLVEMGAYEEKIIREEF